MQPLVASFWQFAKQGVWPFAVCNRIIFGARNERQRKTAKELEMKFRDNLLHLRQQRNMTQEQLAMLLGVSRQSVAKWESGQSTPDVDKLMRMADLFDCTLDELVSGDLTQREVDAREVIPEGTPVDDVCGYDAHMRSFALKVATGVAIIIVGFALAALFDALALGSVSEAASPAAFLLCVAVGLAFILPAGMAHSSFAKSHPFVEDFYTEKQIAAEQRSFARSITIGIVLIVLGVATAAVADVSSNDLLRESGGAVMLAFIAVGVWLIVHGGIIHGLMDVENYNREREDEKNEYNDPRISRACGIIMLVATALGLLMLFGSMAASDMGNATLTTVCSYFWVVWPIGGILCAIVSVAMRNPEAK